MACPGRPLPLFSLGACSHPRTPFRLAIYALAGGLAAFLTTAAYVPHYGLHIGGRPVTMSNVVTAGLAGILLVLKRRATPTDEAGAQ